MKSKTLLLAVAVGVVGVVTLATPPPASSLESGYISTLGDPLLSSNTPAVMLTGWNFCNQAEAPPSYPSHPSPRWADCQSPTTPTTELVSAASNALGPGDVFPLPGYNATTDANVYAVEKGLYLAQLCSRAPAPSVLQAPGNWSYHTIMFKSGNMNIGDGICPETFFSAMTEEKNEREHRQQKRGRSHLRQRLEAPPPSLSSLFIPSPDDSSSSSPTSTSSPFLHTPNTLRFNNLPMNQPLVTVHQASIQPVPYNGEGFVGWFAGTYDVDPTWSPAQITAIQTALDNYTAAWVAFRFAEIDGVDPLPPRPDASIPGLLVNKSYVAAIYYKNISSGSTVFFHIQATSAQAPWLMNYYKLMDATGFGGGYDYLEGGQIFGPVPSYLSRLQVTYKKLDEAKGGFGGLYVPCHGGCWKLNGSACDGDVFTDITRYICFVAESGSQGCSAKSQGSCPPFHILSGSGERVFPNDTSKFPYSCYAGYCPPGGCDPYSNPGPQELMMLLPCNSWEEHGYPSNASQYDGIPMTLDVGAIGARVALSGVEPEDVGPAVRAARGWAPLPPASSLPPYPGWTRSWVGFDFGQEQPNPGLVRYEWTGVDLSVMSV